MKKIILYIAASLDGRIAEPDGTVDFLSTYPVNEEMNYGYNDFMASVDTVLMGGRTYREILNMDVIWPYKEQTTYVVTRGWTEKTNGGDVQFITENVIETISGLRDSEGKDIFLCGGGQLTAMLLQAGLVDEMRIFYVPVILGKGIPLFPEQPTGTKWTMTGNHIYPNGVLGLTYQKL